MLCSLCSSGLDVLIGGHLIVIRTEYFHGDEAVLEVVTDCLQRISETLVIQAAARVRRPQTLCIGVVASTSRNVLGVVQMPYEDLVAVSLLQLGPVGTHAIEVVLVEGNAHQRGVNQLDDLISVIKGVDGHGRSAAELEGQLQTSRFLQ